MGYIAEMRKYVGHKTIIQCAASTICIDDLGRILLGKRTDNHKWGYSGGAVEIDEYVEDCAKRELYEEMGLIADKLEFFYINSGPEAHYIYPNGDEVSNFEIIYICWHWHGEAKPKDGEMDELRFMYPDEIDINEISPPIRRVFTELFSREDLKPLPNKGTDKREAEVSESLLIDNIEKIHTTDMGKERIRKNLSLDNIDIVKWCREKILDKDALIERRGKNWYITIEGCVITVNASSLSIITAHKKK